MIAARLKHLVWNWALAITQPFPLMGLAKVPGFVRDFRRFRGMTRPLPVGFKDTYPCLFDRSDRTPIDSHYFFQATWISRKLSLARPDFHVDVGSSVATVGTMSAFVETVFLDYRPLHVALSGLRCVGGDITRLPFADDSIASLSCLHVIEHVGLGRYGDPLDPEGSAKAAGELGRVLAPGGVLYLSVPVGEERVCFNAHRVFRPGTILAMFPRLKLAHFALVGDDGKFMPDADPDAAQGLRYGCGMFQLEKPIA